VGVKIENVIGERLQNKVGNSNLKIIGNIKTNPNL
jgi:hypothetical protein